MGRGRAKAKQQKVARELKYNSQHTDFNALQHELAGPSNTSSSYVETDTDDEDEQDDWASASR